MSFARDELLRDNHLLLDECDVRVQRRSGPGGQHRNKVETGVFLIHRPSGITVSATERRERQVNQQVAIERLRIRLAVTYRSQARSPSALWQSRCRSRRIMASRQHRDYACLLAEAFDHLAHAGWQVPPAASRLQCSTTSLARLIKRDTTAWTYLQQQRKQQGLPTLH